MISILPNTWNSEAVLLPIQPLTGVRCASPSYRRGHPQRQLETMHLCGMWRGDIDRVLERVRLQGPAEVRRTWGAGVRALRAEFDGFSLR